MNQNGKGSAPRQRTAQERKRFENNYDAIFRKPKTVRSVMRDFRHLTRKKS